MGLSIKGIAAMNAYRCPMCLVNWPHHSLYQPCPECGEQTSAIRDIEPIDADEALSRKRHADFERYCEDRDNRRFADELERLKAGSQ